MKKREAAKLFGNQSKLAMAIGISKSAVSQWPEELSQSSADRVIGAAVRLGLIIPSEWKKEAHLGPEDSS